MKYDNYSTTQKSSDLVSDDNTTNRKSSDLVSEENTTNHKSSDLVLEENTTAQKSSDLVFSSNTTNRKASDLVLEENTTNDQVFKPSTSGKSNDNLSLRWAKKQPTKCELVESFLDLKGSMSIMSNNVMAMERRLSTVETNLTELIAYINQKL